MGVKGHHCLTEDTNTELLKSFTIRRYHNVHDFGSCVRIEECLVIVVSDYHILYY